MNTKIRWFVISVLSVALIVLAVVYITGRFCEPEIGHGTAKKMTITMTWNGQTAEIPAPVQFPQWGRQTREFRRWSRTKDVRNFTTSDLEGYTYTAHGLGFSSDPQDPKGKLIPDINAVSRYRSDGTIESCTSYNFHGPSEWSKYDEQGNRIMLIMKTSIGLEVVFENEDGKRYKEWNINKKGQIYHEAVRQEDGKWIVTQDLEELKTADDTPWADNLREIMEYYPGIDNQ